MSSSGAVSRHLESAELRNFDAALERLAKLMEPSPAGKPNIYPAFSVFMAIEQSRLLFRQGARAILLRRGGISAEALEDLVRKALHANKDSAQPLKDLRNLIQVSLATPAASSVSPALLAAAIKPPVQGVGVNPKKTIFIVHGHRPGVLKAVRSALSSSNDFDLTVLGRVVNKGRTIIEKFDETARKADLAIVIATADDLGAARKRSKKGRRRYRERARQNVIFEGGYFIGRVGRAAVIFLYEEGVELPSDLGGVAYIRLDSGGRWKKSLLEELRASLSPT